MTGVQTCALPIWDRRIGVEVETGCRQRDAVGIRRRDAEGRVEGAAEIGRASCRERV